PVGRAGTEAGGPALGGERHRAPARRVVSRPTAPAAAGPGAGEDRRSWRGASREAETGRGAGGDAGSERRSGRGGGDAGSRNPSGRAGGDAGLGQGQRGR